jgi:hypothetical protein
MIHPKEFRKGVHRATGFRLQAHFPTSAFALLLFCVERSG